jgi:hypothetical protein
LGAVARPRSTPCTAQGTGSGPLVVYGRLLGALFLLALMAWLLSGCVSAGGAAAPTAFSPPETARLATATPRPAPASPTAIKPTATWVPLVTPSPTPDIPRLDVDEASALVDAGRALLVDVRGPVAYRSLRIAGALSLPAYQMADRYAELPAGRLLIFYCA